MVRWIFISKLTWTLPNIFMYFKSYLLSFTISGFNSYFVERSHSQSNGNNEVNSLRFRGVWDCSRSVLPQSNTFYLNGNSNYIQCFIRSQYTEKEAKSLGVRGWCMNTNDGTVKGQLEGTPDKVTEMQHWLKTKGSPTSRIDKTVFSEARQIDDYTFADFGIKR